MAPNASFLLIAILAVATQTLSLPVIQERAAPSTWTLCGGEGYQTNSDVIVGEYSAPQSISVKIRTLYSGFNLEGGSVNMTLQVTSKNPSKHSPKFTIEKAYPACSVLTYPKVCRHAPMALHVSFGLPPPTLESNADLTANATFKVYDADKKLYLCMNHADYSV
ncbi:hypothetical protein HDU98_009872 [Podochytrium sp. JEL0797]|nr:hypothetical protein HDU98_009872 [Podochytrium sp. JEL0797]